MFKQVDLTFGYDSLPSCINEETMSYHHGKHHVAYTNTLNVLAEKAGVLTLPIEEILSSLDKIEDPVLRVGIRNNGGGFFNHNMYFEQLGKETSIPTGLLAEKIDSTFGSFDSFKEQISTLAVSQFGSGWAWLSVTPKGELVLSKTSNQDNDYSLNTGNTPIFTIDVWEHAYYIVYRNNRAQYVKDFFNIINWKIVEERLVKALIK